MGDPIDMNIENLHPDRKKKILIILRDFCGFPKIYGFVTFPKI